MTQLDSSKTMWEKCWDSQFFSTINIIDYGRKVYARALKNFFKNQIHKTAEFLELGCGTATLGTMIAPEIKSYTGFDIARNALTMAEKNFRNSNISNYFLVEEDILQSMPKKQYDLVFSQGLVEHFNNTAQIIDIHLSHCKKGGYVYITVPAKYSYHFLWHFITRLKFMRRFWPWADCIFLTRKIFHTKMKEVQTPYSNYSVQYLPPRFLGVLVLTIQK